MFPIIIQAQVYFDVPLPLTCNKITSEEYLDGVRLYTTSGGYEVFTLLKTKYRLVEDDLYLDKTKQFFNIKVLGTYHFDDKMKLVDSLQQIIDYRLRVDENKKIWILDRLGAGQSAVLAETKDLLSLAQAQTSKYELNEEIYPTKVEDSLSIFQKEPISFKRSKEYLPTIYNNDIKMNMVGKVKGFTNSELRLKNDAERAKVKKAFFDKGIEGEYNAVGKEINFDHFLDDPKNDKIRLMNSSCHEITGNVIACFSHPEKFLYKEFSFWGFDAEGKILNSYYKDFDEENAWPSIAVINDSEPFLYSRPAKQFNYFFPASTGKPLYIITQDKDGKVISEKTYPANVPGGSLLKSKINEDGSQSLITIARWNAGTTLNSFYIDKNDQLTTNSYFLEVKKKDQFLPRTLYGYATHFVSSNSNLISVYQQYFIKKNSATNTAVQNEENIYEGFILLASDNVYKPTEVLHIDKGFHAEGNKNPFTTEFYDAGDDYSIIIISRKATITQDKVLTKGQDYVIIFVDKEGKIIDKEKIKPAFTKSENILRPTSVRDMFYLTPDRSKQSMTLVKLRKPE